MPPNAWFVFYAFVILQLAFPVCAAHKDAQHTSGSAGTIPRPDHVVIVIEENKSFAQIIARSVTSKTPAAYINTLASRGALFTNSFALAHPSQPNYLALFSG